MKKRPDHASDCQACDGWTTEDLLCPRCQKAVHRYDATLIPKWMTARASYVEQAKAKDDGIYHRNLLTSTNCMEHFWRGIIIGSARVLKSKQNGGKAA